MTNASKLTIPSGYPVDDLFCRTLQYLLRSYLHTTRLKEWKSKACDSDNF